MKKVLFIFLSIFAFYSCDDGDVDIPAMDFDEEVNRCDLIFNDYTLFRLGGSEALIVLLSNSVLKEEETTDPIYVAITETNVMYRTFNNSIDKNYFCNAIPPTSPTVLKNWTGVRGENNNIVVETVAEKDGSDNITGYKHTITFENLNLENGGNFIIYEETDFGEIIIPVSN